jgi:hypothetical protein
MNTVQIISAILAVIVLVILIQRLRSRRTKP